MRGFLEAAATATLPILRLMDAEAAHKVAIRALAAGVIGRRQELDHPMLAVRAIGQTFTNPIGLAAGFDKDAEAVLPLMQLGFGFLETGTVTRLPQRGNPRPRLFRLDDDRAVINRMGFNNKGVESYCTRLRLAAPRPRPLGANVGINKDGADPERDYPAVVSAVAPYVDYVTLNVSSPNTPGLRDLQSATKLRAILRAVATELPVCPPILVKLSPDLSDKGIEDVVQVAIEEGASGLIVSNTTVVRDAELTSRHTGQSGGLSGGPLFRRSTEVLLLAARLARGRLLMVGCGGVRTGADALAKIKAGATLIQLYTEFAYVGPTLIPRLKNELLDALRREGFARLSDAVGSAL